MVQVESNLVVIDNSNIFNGRCVHIFGGFKHKYATVGDFILVSVKDKLKKKKLRVKLYLGIVVSVNVNKRRVSGNFIKFDNNRILLFSDKENLLGTKVLEPVSISLRKHKLMRVPLLSRHFI